MLRSAILLSAVGVGILLGVDRMVNAAPSALAAASTSDARLLTSSSGASSASGNSLTVKVTYLGMPQSITNTRAETFVLESPAYFHNLMSNVVGRHPLLSEMIPAMMIFVDGLPPQSSTALEDGDEVDLVPATAGG
jgi:molybdopterin converting factor small subunit